MPSPGISFGDLAVFIAVLVIVAVFLMAVRSFIKRVETPDESVEPQRRQPQETRVEKSSMQASQKITPSHSAPR